MSLIVKSVPQMFTAYKNWVCRNPQLTSEIECSVKWISYLLAGKLNDSTVLTELIYSVSNLWVLLNDKILLSAQDRLQLDGNIHVKKLKTWLTVIEYSEVFFEVSARRMGGNRVKWIVITAIQIFKCALRLMLSLKYRVNMLPNPAITPLDRKKLQEDEPLNNIVQQSGPSEGFVLESGRTIRTVQSASTSARTWKPPVLRAGGVVPIERHLSSKQRIGEIVYIVKPLIQLASMYMSSEVAWPPWLVSLALDCTSISLLDTDQLELSSKSTWNKSELVELQRRKLMLLLYLLRSPFYDKYTKRRLNKLLQTLSNSIPLIGLFLRPLNDYLPHWQKIHFYIWSS